MSAALASLFVEIALKSSAVLIVAAFATLLLRRASAALRHFVWATALVGALVLPLLRGAVPLTIALPDVGLMRVADVSAQRPQRPITHRHIAADGAAAPVVASPAEPVRSIDAQLGAQVSPQS